MSKIISLFNIEQSKATSNDFLKKNNKADTDSILPVIHLPKKKASKNDSPLEKEMRRFNKLIKEIHEYEESERKKKANEERYEQLYQQKVVPQLIECASLKLELAERMETVVTKAKLTKIQLRLYTEFVIAFLDEVAPYNETIMQLLHKKMSEQVNLLSKKNKVVLQDIIEASGLNTESLTSENFNLHDFFEENKEHLHNTFKTDEKEKIDSDINALYKTLVKELHPDAEPEEAAKQQKHYLMQQLIEAKNNNDLYSMLQLKFLIGQKKNNPLNDSEFYSLDKLKRLNKMLKKRADVNRANYTEKLFESLRMDNGFMFMEDPDKSAEARIDDEVNELDNIIATVKKDLESPLTLEALLEILGYFKSSNS